jgi:hypothetical protein
MFCSVSIFEILLKLEKYPSLVLFVYLGTKFGPFSLFLHNLALQKMTPLPRGKNADIIKPFTKIARTTDQSSKIMNFPPIDHDSSIWYVSVYIS